MLSEQLITVARDKVLLGGKIINIAACLSWEMPGHQGVLQETSKVMSLGEEARKGDAETKWLD